MKRHSDPIPNEQDADPTGPPTPQPGARPRRVAEEVENTAGELRRQIFALVYRQLGSMVGRSADLDDLAQTAAEQSLRSLDAFEGRSELSTWTYRICYHTLLAGPGRVGA